MAVRYGLLLHRKVMIWMSGPNLFESESSQTEKTVKDHYRYSNEEYKRAEVWEYEDGSKRIEFEHREPIVRQPSIGEYAIERWLRNTSASDVLKTWEIANGLRRPYTSSDG
jgi:hypothetical protein